MLKYIIFITFVIVCIGLIVDYAVTWAENKYNGTNVSDCRTWSESALRYALTILIYFYAVYLYFVINHPELVQQYLTQLNSLQ